MKIKVLGSGASEGTPTIYCTCPVCTNARKVGGKEVRHRTSYMLDDDTLIDFSPDMLALSGAGLDLTDIEHILITHSHSDHFDLETMLTRSSFNAIGGPKKPLHIYGNEEVVRAVENYLEHRPSVKQGVFTHLLEYEKTVQVGKYSVTPLKSTHIQEENCLAYLINDGGKYYLHLTDSSFPENEVFEYIRIHKIKLALVALDCTCGGSDLEFYGHMNLKQNIQVKERFEQIGAIDSSSIVIATHIAHCSGFTHEEFSIKAAQYGIGVAYDGLTLEI